MSRQVLLFSGGYDSTYLLAKLVSEASSDDTIVAVTVKHNLTGVAKLRREYESQIMTIRALREHYPDVNIVHEIIRIESEWQCGDTYNSKGLAQPLLWLCNIVPLIEDNDVVHCGYIKDDQAIIHLDDLKALWDIMMKLQWDKKIGLEFPLKYCSKTDIVKLLLERFDYLINNCVSCENVGYDASKVCGECTPCEHLKTALLSCSIDHNPDVAAKGKEMLERLFNLKVSVENASSSDQLEIDSVDDESCEDIKIDDYKKGASDF